MGSEIRELEQRIIDLLEQVCGEELNCDGIKCEQCPLHQSNLSITTSGFHASGASSAAGSETLMASTSACTCVTWWTAMCTLIA